MTAEEILQEYAGIIDQEIERVFQGRNQGKLYDMMKYHLGWLDENLKPVERHRGKRFRPTLCLLAYHSLAGVYDKALPAAAAIELIHNFSLIHDDIEDKDETRRGKPTLWKLFGIEHAINAGDGMHVLANLAALRLEDVNVSPDKVVKVMRILNNTVMELCEGQYLDMSFEKKMEVKLEQYLEMIYKKTAALIEASLWIGSLLATENRDKIEHFKNFGRNIGLAFQIVDDIIGIWSEKTGKPRASDIRNKKKTLPVIYAMERAPEEKKKRLLEIYSKNGRLSNHEVAEVLEILEETGARDYAMKLAREYENKALYELDSLGINNSSIEKIRVLTRFLVTRSY